MHDASGKNLTPNSKSLTRNTHTLGVTDIGADAVINLCDSETAGP
jgi:hypothetical protein